MRKWKVIVAGVMMVGAAVASAVYAEQKSGKTLAPQDYIDIQQLCVRYNWAFDMHADNGLAWAKTFTRDGEFWGSTARMSGRDKLTEFARLKSGNPATLAPHHYVINFLIEPSPEGAHVLSYFMNVSTPEPNQPVVVSGTGTYEDIVVRTSEGWRFKQRRFRASVLPASMVPATTSN